MSFGEGPHDVEEGGGAAEPDSPGELPLSVSTVNESLTNNNTQGKYSVLADVYTKDQKKVTCLKADGIEFKFF